MNKGYQKVAQQKQFMTILRVTFVAGRGSGEYFLKKAPDTNQDSIIGKKYNAWNHVREYLKCINNCFSVRVAAIKMGFSLQCSKENRKKLLTVQFTSENNF